ncbi:MAG: transcription termination/antitermination protein NusA [Anaerolineae bacterium]|nr:transcription termination/antitermination protein NusA [Anaerolineae bacterium]
MKSEFALAFNQICAEYNLPREIVLDAVRAALATAYRRDWKISANQNISADINLDTGLAKIYLEKTVTETVEDRKSEIRLVAARKIDRDVQIGDILMVDVTPSNFGRIAAQTAKQVITQRLREAERESQFNRFSRQEGEIIIGTIQSINPRYITLHLERTEEAHMPKHEQIQGERYTLHQKVRVYVVDVRRTPRGPEIVVSRSHPNMLRRMLELEVPEIRSGQVEIKAIAREAGARSKIAVVARQPGLDPVGACVGMRGIRIQTISRELHGERIDVVEWHEDPATFISNALSVSSILIVMLDENRQGGRTASVIVEDDQLSLAIGRAGQNARLAAKLTNWRIDIQGATEAGIWALEQVNEDPDLLGLFDKDIVSLVPRLATTMRSHEQDKYPYTDEERQHIKTVVEAVHRAQVAKRELEHQRQQQEREAAGQTRQSDIVAERHARQQEAKDSVPEEAYTTDLESLELSEKVLGHLERNEIASVGKVMELVALGDEALLILNGIGSKALKEIKQAIETVDFDFVEPAPESAEIPVETVEVMEPVMLADEISEDITEEVTPEVFTEEKEVVPAAVVQEASAEDTQPEIQAIEDTTQTVEESLLPEATVTPQEESTIKEQTEDEKTKGQEDIVFDMDDIDTFDVYEEDDVLDSLDEDKDTDKSKKGKKKKRRTLIYDEESGETFAVRKGRRRRSHKDGWDDYLG